MSAVPIKKGKRDVKAHQVYRLMTPWIRMLIHISEPMSILSVMQKPEAENNGMGSLTISVISSNFDNVLKTSSLPS